MWGCGGGGFGLGLLGGAMLASSMAPAYYSAPVVVQQPPVVIQTDQSTNSSQPHSHVHAMHPMYPQSTHPHPHAYIPPPPPTYEERQRLYASGYGPDPDVVFYLFERLDTNSLCGIPGPWCSLGTAIQLFSPRSVPAELSDIYTVDEWITLRRSIEGINSKYQWHPCPLFCLYLCCVPSCLQSTKEYDLSLLLNHETHRLKPQGLFWHIPEETDSVDFTTKGLDLRLLACLKVDVLMRKQFEMDHPTRRRIAKQLYGNIVMPMPIAPSNVIDTPRSSLFKPVAIHGEVGHSLEPSS